MSIRDCFQKCHLLSSTFTFVIKHLRAIFENVLLHSPWLSFLYFSQMNLQTETFSFQSQKSSTIFSEYDPLKRTYHFQHHEKEFLGKDRLEGGSRRMQLSASAERKKKTERVVRVKGCLLITAFNSFFHNLGERWSDFQTLKGQGDYLVNRHMMLFLFIFLALYFCENHFLQAIIFNMKIC